MTNCSRYIVITVVQPFSFHRHLLYSTFQCFGLLAVKMSVDGREDAQKHDIFEEDPGDLMRYVYKEIEICTVDGRSHRGWVYTVDPVSLTFGLVQFLPQKQVSQIEFILGHAIKDIVLLSDDVDAYKDALDCLFKSASSAVVSSAELTCRRGKVVSWMMKNRIPIETCREQPDVLSIGDVLLISPPYLPENCQSTNGIILNKIQELLKRLPEDSNEDINQGTIG